MSSWDVYLVHARLSPEGALLGIADVYDLTNTSAVNEEHLTTDFEHAAWKHQAADRTYRIETANLAGESLPKESPAASGESPAASGESPAASGDEETRGEPDSSHAGELLT